MTILRIVESSPTEEELQKYIKEHTYMIIRSWSNKEKSIGVTHQLKYKGIIYEVDSEIKVISNPQIDDIFMKAIRETEEIKPSRRKWYELFRPGNPKVPSG